jgi:hypothetical protein
MLLKFFLFIILGKRDAAMVALDDSIKDFLEDPNSYVLRLKDNSLRAEKKGLWSLEGAWTWIKANILDRSSYRLPHIIDQLKEKNINQPPSTDINLNNLEEKLEEKVRNYNETRPIWFEQRKIDVQIPYLVSEAPSGAKPSPPPPHEPPRPPAPPPEEQGEEQKTPHVQKTGPTISDSISPQVPLSDLNAGEKEKALEKPPVPIEEQHPPIKQFPHQEQVQSILGKGRLQQIFFTQSPEEGALQNAIGLKIISDSGFKIAHATGDGNCLFTSIAMGLLARKSSQEVIGLLSPAIGKALEFLQTDGAKLGLNIDLEQEWALLYSRLLNKEASSEIEQILTNPEVRNNWAKIFRTLSLIRQIQWDSIGFIDLWQSAEDHDISVESFSKPVYIQQMMVTQNPTIWGSASDIMALQSFLNVHIPWLSGISSAAKNDVAITHVVPNSSHLTDMPLSKLSPDDIVILFNPSSKHYDPAFYIPPPS